MDNEKRDPLSILAIAIAAVVTTATSPGSFDLWDTMIGLILFIILLANRNQILKSFLHNLAFSCVLSFCFLMISGVFIENLLPKILANFDEVRDIAFFGIWLVLTFMAYLARRKNVLL